MMKRLLLLMGLIALGTTTAFAQDTVCQNPHDYYISETIGDTLVVNNYWDVAEEPNTLLCAIRLDDSPPDGRVYKLKAGTFEEPSLYPFVEQYDAPDRPIKIVGEYVGSIVQGDDPNAMPPILSGWLDETGAATNFQILNVTNDITLKNLAILPASPDANEGWFFFNFIGEDRTVRIENVLGEHNLWVWFNNNEGVNTSIYIKDSYFLNATGLATRRNGGIYDSVGQPLDTLWVENTTHLQNAGMQYKFRNFPANKAVFNHNTFVNASGQALLSFGYETDFTVTNNLFVNSNAQAYWPGLDAAEADQDNLPHGLINLDHLPGGIGVDDADRKVLVDLNGVYWDERLNDIVGTLESRGWNGGICSGSGCEASGQWYSQAFIANERTQEILDDEDRYPRITEGEWIQAGAPGFTRGPEDVDPTIMDAYIEWNVETVSDENSTLLRKLRTPENPAEEGLGYLRFDWPVAVDLAYSNSEYLTGGFGGYPLGDLNWYPAEKAQWIAERDDLYAQIEAALEAGSPISTAIEQVDGELPSTTRLAQNYPNPFNPTTTIRFELADASQVELAVYDVLGRRVATLVNDRMAAGTYSVDWNALDETGQAVSSGVYVYSLRTGDQQVVTRQMVVLK